MSGENRQARYSDAFGPVKVAQQLYDKYDFVSAFTVADSTTDYNVKTQQSTSFYNISKAWLCIIWTDQDISVKINSTSNPAITIPATESPFEFRDIFEITNVYITNASGSAASVKIMLV